RWGGLQPGAGSHALIRGCRKGRAALRCRADCLVPLEPTAARKVLAAQALNSGESPVLRRASRVERWRGSVGRAYLFAGSFVCRCLTSPTVLRFHLPLIEPDGRISRIRLSDKDSCFRPREGARPHAESSQTQLLVQVCVREACCPVTLYLV